MARYAVIFVHGKRGTIGYYEQDSMHNFETPAEARGWGRKHKHKGERIKIVKVKRY